MHFLYSFILLSFLCVPYTNNAQAAERQYGSLRKDEVNVRAGPGKQYPILWIFRKRSYPVEIIAEYQYWYKIRDPEGEEGWVYNKLISKKLRTALVKGKKNALMYQEADLTIPLYKLEPGVIVGISQCSELVCQVYLDRNKGWMRRNNLAMVD